VKKNRPRPVYGVSLGILMLDTKFERRIGDVGNALSWRFPVHYRIVSGVDTDRVATGDPDAVLTEFYRGIDDLVSLGVDGISTSCSKLSALHPRLRAYSPVPFVTSSLQQIPLVLGILPKGQTVGVLVSNASAISDASFFGTGAPTGLPIAELPKGGAFRSALEGSALQGDFAKQEREILDTAEMLLRGPAEIGAIVCECVNLAPFSSSLRNRFGLPVFDIVTLLEWFHGGLQPRRFSSEHKM